MRARNKTEPAGGESSAHAVARTDNARLRVTDRSMAAIVASAWARPANSCRGRGPPRRTSFASLLISPP